MKLSKKELLDINKDFYENFGESFSSKRFFNWESFDRLKGYIKKTDRVLDIGSGNGRLSTIVDKNKYLGIDFSLTLISIAQEKYPGYRFIERDISNNEWYKGIGDFDKIFAIAFLHHIPTYSLRLKLFKDIKNILSASGLFIFSIWNFDEKIISSNIGKDDYLLSWNRSPDLRYVHRFDKGEVEQISKDAGFRIIEDFNLEQNIYFILSPIYDIT
jgi:SAM-dependent methyltransferase